MRKTAVFGIIATLILLFALPAFGGDCAKSTSNCYDCCCCCKPSTDETVTQACAREIMGANFFGVEEAIKHFGVSPTRQQLAVLSEIPFTEAVLQSRKATHILVAIFPLSILEIREKVEHKLFYRHEDARYNNQAFAKDKGEVGWHLIRHAPIENSTSKTWSAQQAMLGKNEVTPSARVMIYTIIGHYLATGGQLFKYLYVRCSDVDFNGNRVHVGGFNKSGLGVNGYWDGYRDSLLGLASSRKPAP